MLGFLTPFYDLYGKSGFRDKLHTELFKKVVLSDKWKILDVGCGTGEDLISIRKKLPNAELIGIDADPKIIEIAKRKVRKKGIKIGFRVALAEKLPYKNNYFDAVFCSLTLHHLPTEFKKRAIKEIHRVLKPKRKCFLVISSRPNNPILARIASIQNLIEHTRDNYEGRIPQFVKGAGFKNIKEEKVWAHILLIQAMK